MMGVIPSRSGHWVDMAAGSAQTVCLTVPARPDYVALARLALSGVCRAAGVSPEPSDDLKLAVTEAAARFVMSAPDGAGGAPERQLSYEFHVDGERLVIEIGGAPLRWLPDDELALARAIVQATVDGWSEEADRVRLVKFLGPRAE